MYIDDEEMANSSERVILVLRKQSIHKAGHKRVIRNAARKDVALRMSVHYEFIRDGALGAQAEDALFNSDGTPLICLLLDDAKETAGLSNLDIASCKYCMRVYVVASVLPPGSSESPRPRWMTESSSTQIPAEESA